MMTKKHKLPHLYVWLLFAGPFAVIVAALFTAWLAWKDQDPVIEEHAYRKGIELSEMPAQRARNHSVTPTEHLPAPQKKVP
jgi:uncharacterized protein